MGAGTIITGIAVVAAIVLLRFGLQWYDLWTTNRAEERRHRDSEHGHRA